MDTSQITSALPMSDRRSDGLHMQTTNMPRKRLICLLAVAISIVFVVIAVVPIAVVLNNANSHGNVVVTRMDGQTTTNDTNTDEEDVKNNEGETTTEKALPIRVDNIALLRVITLDRYIAGITVLDTELLVVRGGSKHVNVYSTIDFTFIRNIYVSGSSNLSAIVSSPRCNCLYISDVGLKVIHRYNLSNNVTTKWSVGEECERLSLTSTGNILVTLQHSKQIQEFKPNGSLIRNISLDSSIEYPHHSVQLSSDRFVVSHGLGRSLHRVCLVDTSGRIIQCYGGASGSGVGQLNVPQHLAVYRHGIVLVADSGNDRFVPLSPSFTFLGNIMPPGLQITGPYTLHVDKLTRRFYVGACMSGTGHVIVLGAS